MLTSAGCVLSNSIRLNICHERLGIQHIKDLWIPRLAFLSVIILLFCFFMPLKRFVYSSMENSLNWSTDRTYLFQIYVAYIMQLTLINMCTLMDTKVRYIGVSNETSYGVMEFVHAAKVEGLPKIVSIQNNYSLLVRCKFEVDLVEVCHPNNCNIGLLAYSPLGGGALSGKYLDIESEAARKGRLNLFPGYMERYNKSPAQEATAKYIELAKKYGLSPVQIALAFVRDRSFVTSSIIGATSVEQLKEDIDAVVHTQRPLPADLMTDIESLFKRYKDPAIL